MVVGGECWWWGVVVQEGGDCYVMWIPYVCRTQKVQLFHMHGDATNGTTVYGLQPHFIPFLLDGTVIKSYTEHPFDQIYRRPWVLKSTPA